MQLLNLISISKDVTLGGLGIGMEDILCIHTRIENTKVLSADTEFLDNIAAIFPVLDRIVLPALLGGAISHVCRCRNSTGGSGSVCGAWLPNGTRRRMVLGSRLIHTNLSADGAVEVVAATIDPGIVRTQLHSCDVMCLGNTVAGISFLDGIDLALALDAQIPFRREVMTICLQVVVE